MQLAAAQDMLPVYSSVQAMQARDGQIMPAMTAALETSLQQLLDPKAAQSQDSLAQVAEVASVFQQLQAQAVSCQQMPTQVSQELQHGDLSQQRQRQQQQ